MYGRDGTNDTVGHPIESHLILSDQQPSNNSGNHTLLDRHPELSEHFHRLGQGFAFSRWFILTYQPVVIGVVLIVAAWRWQSRRARIQRRGKRRPGEKRRDGDVKERTWNTNDATSTLNGEGSSSSSSSSRTREGDATPPTVDKASDEWTRLLKEGQPDLAKKKTGAWQTIHRWTKACLTYQPAPIPLVRKILPPNTTSLWITILFILNIYYLLCNVGVSPSTQDIVADRAGLLFIANLPWLYFLAAKTQPLKLLTGDSYENLNMLHRRLGEWMCFLAFLHLAGMLWGWYDFLRPAGFGLLWFLTIGYVLWGCGAWIAYEVLYVMSLGSFREWWYEVFLGSHILLQAGGLILLWLHHFRARPFVLVCAVIFLLDRFLWRSGIKACYVRAELQVLEDGETVLVSADWPVKTKTGPGNWWGRVLGWDMRFGWNPSEHVFISVPGGMGSRYMHQAHPMTIASAAPAPGQMHAWFNLIIRAKAGFSRDLLHYAQTTKTTTIRLDGPYGSLHALEMLHDSDVAVIVAGGSGIAVAYPLLWSLFHHKSTSDGAESRPAKQQVCLIWIIQDESHVSWIGAERLHELKELGLHLVVPPPSRKHGRPDVQSLLKENVEQLTEPDSTVGVIVSGPDGLNRTVQNACAELIRKGMDVEVTVEKFGW